MLVYTLYLSVAIMKIPETGNVGAYYGNEENGQWQVIFYSCFTLYFQGRAEIFCLIWTQTTFPRAWFCILRVIFILREYNVFGTCAFICLFKLFRTS